MHQIYYCSSETYSCVLVLKSVEYISEYHSVRKRLIFGDKDVQHAIIKQKLLSWKHALNQAEKKINNTWNSQFKYKYHHENRFDLSLEQIRIVWLNGPVVSAISLSSSLNPPRPNKAWKEICWIIEFMAMCITLLLFLPRRWGSWLEHSTRKVGCSNPSRDRPKLKKNMKWQLHSEKAQQ